MPSHQLHHHHHHLRRQLDWMDPNANLAVVEAKAKTATSTAVPDVATLVSVVYVTASPTFAGPVGGYTTIGLASVAPTSPAPAIVSTPDGAESTALAISSALMQTVSSSNTPDPSPTTTAVPETPSSSLLNSIEVTSVPSSVPSFAATDSSSPSAAAASATSTLGAMVVSQTSTGLSGGAKAGIAFAVILGIAAVVIGLLAFFYRRRKLQESEAYGQTENEKNPFADSAATAAPARATTPPRLSLAPMSQFQAEPRPVTPVTATIPSHAVDVEKAQAQVDHSTNPFGQHAEVPPSMQEIPAPLRIKTPSSEGLGTVSGGGMAVGAASATIAQRHNAPKALDFKRAMPPVSLPQMDSALPSPAGTEFSMTSATPSAMAGVSTPLNVHRIQLDFKPSMDDELELRAGQLVRLLHEYDDGWALCIRLDRSQQGVAPRTCLSARPVKPRSKPPGGPQPGIRVPVQGRPMSPANRHMSGPRSMSPGPYGGGPQKPVLLPPGGRVRSNSASDVSERRNGPPGPSPMNPSSQGIRSLPSQQNQASQSTNTSPRSSHGVQRKPVPGRSL